MKKTIDKKNKIREQLDLMAVTFDDFIKVSPYEFDELRGKSRERNLTDWRQVGLVIAFVDTDKHIKWNLNSSARLFDKDHATVLHSIRKVTETIYYTHIIDMIREQRDKRIVAQSIGEYEEKEINHTTEAFNMVNRINTTGKKDDIVNAVMRLRSYINENINPNK